MPGFDASRSLGFYRLGQEDDYRRREQARKQAELAERRSAIQAVIDARMGSETGGLSGKVAGAKPASSSAEAASTPTPSPPTAAQTGLASHVPFGNPLNPNIGTRANEIESAVQPVDVPPSSVAPAGGPEVMTQADAIKAANIRLLAIDPELAMQLEDHFAKVGKAEREAFEAKMGIMGSAAAKLKSMQPGARAGLFQSVIAPALIERGWTQDELAKADLSDNGLDSYIAMAMDTEKILSEARQRSSDAETSRHNRATETAATRRADIAQSALDLARRREGRVAAKDGGGDTGGLSTADLLKAAGL